MHVIGESARAKACALRFLGAYWAGDRERTLAECTEDAIVELAPSLAVDSPAPMSDVLHRVFRTIYPRFRDGCFGVQILGCVAEGNTVAVEYKAHGPLADGREFNCRYFAVLETRLERVRVFRPYTDTKYVIDMLSPTSAA